MLIVPGPKSSKRVCKVQHQSGDTREPGPRVYRLCQKMTMKEKFDHHRLGVVFECRHIQRI